MKKSNILHQTLFPSYHNIERLVEEEKANFKKICGTHDVYLLGLSISTKKKVPLSYLGKFLQMGFSFSANLDLVGYDLRVLREAFIAPMEPITVEVNELLDREDSIRTGRKLIMGIESWYNYVIPFIPEEQIYKTFFKSLSFDNAVELSFRYATEKIKAKIENYVHI